MSQPNKGKGKQPPSVPSTASTGPGSGGWSVGGSGYTGGTAPTALSQHPTGFVPANQAGGHPNLGPGGAAGGGWNFAAAQAAAQPPAPQISPAQQAWNTFMAVPVNQRVGWFSQQPQAFRTMVQVWQNHVNAIAAAGAGRGRGGGQNQRGRGGQGG
jgi:hypothetical protein